MELIGNRSEDIEKLIVAQANAQVVRFSHAEIKKFTSNFKSEILGFGGFAVVYKGQISERMTVAIKVLKHTMLDYIEEQFMAEVRVMGEVRHRNLVKLVGFCFEPEMKALAYEFMERGSLDKVLYNNPLNIEWAVFRRIAIETAKGLAYLHDGCEERIIHHDIKAGNVLLDSRLFPKIADFGLARLWDRDMTRIALSGYRGTVGFAAPEVALGWGTITDKCDVFSFGMMLFEILSRKRNADSEWVPGRVWTMYEIGQLDQLIVEYGIGEKDRENAKSLAMVALWCAQYYPEDRPRMSVVVQMLEGVMQYRPAPPNPFRHYTSSSTGSSRTRGSSNPSWDSSRNSFANNQSLHEKGWSAEQNASIQVSLHEKGWSPEQNASIQEEQKSQSRPPLCSNSSTESELMLAKFRQLYPPDGKESIVVYTSSIAGLGDIEHYKAVVSMLEYHKIEFAVHDVSKSMTLLQEYSILLPVLFVKGRSIDYHDLKELREQGKLGILLNDIAKLQKQAEESQLLLGKSSTKCFPGDEDTVAVYATSEGGNFNLCEGLFRELKHFKIKFGVQDVSEAPASKNELGTILGKTIWDEHLPLVLVKERWIHL